LWRQIQAGVYGEAVETIEAEEGSAFGAALLAGVGAGAWNSVDEACAETIKTASRIEPNEHDRPALERNYQAYKRLYSALRAAMDIIAGKQ
jgi:xylulokinase